MDQIGAALVKAVEPYGLVPLLMMGPGIALVAALCALAQAAWRSGSNRR